MSLVVFSRLLTNWLIHGNNNEEICFLFEAWKLISSSLTWRLCNIYDQDYIESFIFPILGDMFIEKCPPILKFHTQNNESRSYVFLGISETTIFRCLDQVIWQPYPLGFFRGFSNLCHLTVLIYCENLLIKHFKN